MIFRLGAKVCFGFVKFVLVVSGYGLWFVVAEFNTKETNNTFVPIALAMLTFPAQPGRKYFHAPLYCWPKRKELLSLFTFTSGVFWLKTNSVPDWLFQIVDSISASDWSIVFKRFPLLSLKNSFFLFPRKDFFLFPWKDLFFSLEKTFSFPSKRLLRSFKIYFYHLG